MAKIRLATAADAKEIAEIYGKVVANTAISFELEPPTEAEMKRRITTTLGSAPWLVCEKNGEVLGSIYASQHSERAAYLWSVNAGVYIREDSHRYGIGRALYTSLLSAFGCRGFIRCMQAQLYPMLEVGVCTSQWASRKLVSIQPLDLNWANGMT